MSVKNLTTDDFEKAVAKGRVLVDCYADWCGPCQMLSPIIEELSDEISDWDFYKLDTDAESEIMEKYEIMSIPTILLFSDGELKDSLVGFKSKEELKKILEKVEEV